MKLYKFIDKVPTIDEAIELFKLKGSELNELLVVANSVRSKYCGDEIQVTTLTNAKSGKCTEDCSFCSQSAHYRTIIEEYTLKDKELIIDEFDRAIQYNGADTFCIVTATKHLVRESEDYNKIIEIASELKLRNHDISLCASLGMINTDVAIDLKNAGIDIYNANIQTAPSSYKERVASTHSINDRLDTLRAAKQAGLKICTGGIIGLGETYEELVEMAFTLKELDADVVPINVLIPIKGTPMESQGLKSMSDILKTVAIFRLILKKSSIKIGAGREKRLKDFIGTAFMSGANCLISGGYLTTDGRSVDDDKQFIKDIKELWGS